MIKRLCNLYIKRKTKNLTQIPLFTMTFNYKKYKENGKENSCVLYALHPDIARDEFLKENFQKCVDYIRENYDMEVFTKI